MPGLSQISIKPREKYNDEACLVDALKTLGIKDDVPMIDLDGNIISVLYRGLSSEVISLAYALKQILKRNGTSESEFIILINDSDGFSIQLTNTGLKPVEIKGEPTFTFGAKSEFFLESDSPGFTEYSTNKLLAGIILRMNSILTPKEIHLRDSAFFPVFTSKNQDKTIEEVYTERHSKVVKFIKSLPKNSTKFVVKPNDLQCGKGVYILPKRKFINQNPTDPTFPEDTESRIVLIQEKVESYPLIMNGKGKDWNMRVLVTFDPKTDEYIPVGIVCRVDTKHKPVNISISASYHSLSKILGLTDIPEDEHQNIKEKISKIAIQSVRAISDYGNKKEKVPYNLVDMQLLAGVDIILNEDRQPVVIEVNSSNSGCNYELMKLEGIESLYPIAEATIAKAIFRHKITKTMQRAYYSLNDRQKKLFNNGNLTLGYGETKEDGSISALVEEKRKGYYTHYSI